MARIVVLGATGGIGRHLVGELTRQGDTVVAVHQRADQAKPLREQGAEPVHLDIADASRSGAHDRFTTAFRGANAVIYAAGASSAPTNVAQLVDGNGVELAVRAAEEAGVARFLLVSAFPDAWRDQGMPPEFESYMKIKKQADINVAASHLDWVIIRPGTLTNGPRTGQITLGPAIPYGDVSRANVAAVLAELAHIPEIRRSILELTQGATPISAAVRTMRRGI